MAEDDRTAELSERVRAARESATPLVPEGGGTKRFLGRAVQAETLSCAGHAGVVSYEPTELVVTARSATRLAALEAVLAGNGQMLPFEPPHFGEAATVGGTIACGLSGPRRPWAGAARDLVLGVRMINGRGEILRFGGEVMKNVAGYDLSRLLTGSMGTLGVLLDVSMKVLPRPETEATLAFDHTAAEAIRMLNQWSGTPLPLSGACHFDGRTFVRLSGSATGVASSVARRGGDAVDAAHAPWEGLREHRLDYFTAPGPTLWRVSVPSTCPPLALPGGCLVDWGGALRWVRTDADPGAVRSVAAAAGGHAMQFRGGDPRGEVYHPLTPALLRLHQRLKAAFDPHGIFCPGRMYAEL